MDSHAAQLTDLLQILVTEGILSEPQAQTIRIRQGAIRALIRNEKQHHAPRYEVSAVEIILGSGSTDAQGAPLEEERIMAAWARIIDIPYVRIDPLRLDAKLITESFSHAFARNNVLLPLSVQGDELTLATDKPNFEALRSTLRASLRHRPKFVLASKTSILRSISEVYGFRTSVTAAASEQASATTQAQLALGNLEQLVSVRQLEEIDASDSHIINAVDYLLNYAFTQRASDIHLEPRREQSVVRLRIDGVLHEVHKLPILVHAPILSRFKMLARMDIAEKRRPQDGRIKTEFQGQEVELRVSTMPVAFGEKMVIRIFDASKLYHGLDGIGMNASELAKFQRMLAARTGLILVTGPTGSGKTTTLYSALRALHSQNVNITTIEDPVEMVNDAFNQVQVHPKIGLDFSAALRTVLRQDPDIIMVGEIRDEETAHMAVQAALTGHLVLTTLHTNDAASAITRLLDLQVAPFLLSSCLLGCIAQRLVRKICPKCRTDQPLSEDGMRMLGMRASASQSEQLIVSEGSGCLDCRKTGVYGQIGIFEVLEVNANLRRLIHDGVNAEHIKRAACADGMDTLFESALSKLGAGIIPLGEVVRVLGLSEK
ncbi:MAG: GspE/PulE family protein [Proteobacteria bacterium]|nr:GspE/PulE family protein [Pseudomonadota bacterium]